MTNVLFFFFVLVWARDAMEISDETRESKTTEVSLSDTYEAARN